MTLHKGAGNLRVLGLTRPAFLLWSPFMTNYGVGMKMKMIPPGPSEPIIEVVRPIPRGLDISWRTDVTSKQDKYIVVYTRNDTGLATNIETTKMLTQLRDLYPGAGYKIQVRIQHQSGFWTIPPRCWQ